MVYITGRTISEGTSDSGLPGTIYQTAREILDSGGKCIALQCDHRDDDQVQGVFRTIHQRHQNIDILVNNVWVDTNILPMVPNSGMKLVLGYSHSSMGFNVSKRCMGTLCGQLFSGLLC